MFSIESFYFKGDWVVFLTELAFISLFYEVNYYSVPIDWFCDLADDFIGVWLFVFNVALDGV